MTENHTENRLDTAVTKFLEERGQCASRRGMLAQLAKVGLGILGVSVLPSLPIDRRSSFVRAIAQGNDCCLWQLCGICGSTCVGVGPTGTTCPENTSPGAYWTKCCNNGGSGGGCETSPGTEIWYWDCCANNPTTAQAVKATACSNNCPQDAWCPDGYNYYGCTHIEIHGDCSNPTNAAC
jgi:hypothetical protein